MSSHSIKNESSVQSVNVSSDLNKLNEVLFVNNVKITPGYMKFDSVQEGKSYEQKLCIQNCGKNLALVRLCESSSKLFNFKAFPEGIQLSPGMSVCETVSLTYKKVLEVPKTFTTIWINDRKIKYDFIVALNEALVMAVPNILDFGQIDGVNQAHTQNFVLKNVGTKGALFSIDLGRNYLKLVVDPIEGYVPPESWIEIKVEIVSNEQEDFIEEFWIKTEPLQKVIVMGTFIVPKIVVRKSISSLDFTLINFPPTYYGSDVYKTLFIKNFSSSAFMFCVMAEVKGTTMTIDQAKSLDECFGNFIIKPIDGRLAPLKGALIQIIFRPLKNRMSYSACFLKVIQIDCRGIETEPFVTKKSCSTKEKSSTTSFKPTDNLSFEQSISVCLYGDKESPDILLEPNKIYLNNLVLNQTYHRVVLVQNKSKKMAIKIKYHKLASIDVEPSDFDLKPVTSLEVLITIRPNQLSTVVKKVTFDLFHGSYLVGSTFFEVKLCATEVVQVVKTPCKTISLKLEPDSTFKFSAKELKTRIHNNKYYMEYLKAHWTLDKKKESYLGKVIKCEKVEVVPKAASITEIIPLPPHLLYNIKITPKLITLRKIATHTTITEFFEIENQNSFPIDVATSSSKPCIYFDNGRHLVGTKSKQRIFFHFHATSYGRYNITINLIVNYSTLFELTATAMVVPKTVGLEMNEIEFKEEDFKFVKLTNPLNTSTEFEWRVPLGPFKIFPKSGTIPAEQGVLCLVTFNKTLCQNSVIKAELNCESGLQKVLTMSYRKQPSLIEFDQDCVDFGFIPLNILVRRTLILKNLKNSILVFTTKAVPSFDIEPKNGTVIGLSTQVFVVTVLAKALFEFSTRLEFLINYKEKYSVVLKGTVECPCIRLEPTQLYFSRILAKACTILPFKIRNLSHNLAEISFPSDDSPDFQVLESENGTILETLTLHSQQSRVLFLKFEPDDVCSYSMYLPLIINGILGPIHMNSTKSDTVQYFLNTKEYENNVTSLTPNIVLPKLMIRCVASEAKVTFSDLNPKFYFHGLKNPHNLTVHDFEIYNTSSTETVWICIRTDNLNVPFSLVPKSNADIHGVSLKIKLEPLERVVLEAKFEPTVPGSYFTQLPIFLRHYSNNQIFNYLKFEGYYQVPLIIPKQKLYNLEAVPIGVTNEVMFDFDFDKHCSDCKVVLETYRDDVDWSYYRKQENIFTITLRLQTSKELCLVSGIKINCSCEGSTTILLTGTVENCLLTTHAFSQVFEKETIAQLNSIDHFDSISLPSSKKLMFPNLMTNYNTTSFPYFPNELSEYYQYMNSIQKTMENWLSSQAFYKKMYFKIPEGFTHIYKSTKKGTTITCTTLPLLELITNFVGHKTGNKLNSTTEDDPYIYTYKTTCKILQFLRNHAVYAPHVRTKFLLHYDQYLWYQKNKHPEEVPMTEECFHQFSKQCWLDLLLQIIKVFYYFRVVPPSAIDSGFTIYGPREKTLILWLQNCYNDNREKVWYHTVPKFREIEFLSQDLKDCVILATVIGHYCPFMVDEINQLYVQPSEEYEFICNSNVFMKIWIKLNFSLDITPFSILSANLLELLLIVSYLYHILPQYVPKQKVKIEVPLTQVGTRNIELENLGQDPIWYHPEFFHNEKGYFSLELERILVAPKKKKSISVKYHAKAVRNSKATLLLSGETPGQKYAKTLVITLEGVSTVPQSLTEISLNLELYKPSLVKFVLNAPFKIVAQYVAQMGYEPEIFYPSKEIRNLRRIKDCILLDDECLCDSEGTLKVQENLCCQNLGKRSVWYHFQNSDVGDWSAKITINGILHKDCWEEILVQLPLFYTQLQCKCKDQISLMRNCPKLLYIQIPMENHLLWKARKNTLMETVTDEERKFWSKQIYTKMGTRILKLILNSEMHALRQVVKDSEEYDVILNQKLFVSQKEIKIQDTISEDFYFLPIHPIKQLSTMKQYKLQLLSKDRSERRFYKVHFVETVKNK